MLEDLTQIPSHDVEPSYYSDWGDPREFTLTDMGVGECAGEVVSQAEFTLAASERELFEAQVFFDSGDLHRATLVAYSAMLQAAQGLIKTQNGEAPTDEGAILSEFRQRFCDTELFYHKYAGRQFADYLFKAKEGLADKGTLSADSALRRLQEAQLFIDAAHSCYKKLLELKSTHLPSSVAASPAGS